MPLDHSTPSRTMLSADPVRATQEIGNIITALGDILDEEMNALSSGDAIGFIAIQEAKEMAALNYQNAAKEFRSRLNEFRKVHRTVIARLEAAHEDFGQRARLNLATLDRIRSRALIGGKTIRQEMPI